LGQGPAHRGQPSAQRTRQHGYRTQAQRFAVDVVAAEQLVGPFTRQHHLDVLAGFARHEVEGHQRRVGHWIVQVPHDQRQRLAQFLFTDGLDEVLDADRRRGLGRHVHLGVALALETSSEGEQVRVVLLGERRDGRRINATGQERPDGHVGAHVLADRVVQHLEDPVVQLLGGLGSLDRAGAEPGPEVALGAQHAVVHCEGGSGFDSA